MWVIKSHACVFHNIKESDGIRISIYPNPADKKIYLRAYLPVSEFDNSITKNRSQTITLTIYSALGSELFKKSAAHGETIAVPTDKIPAGMYFLRAEQKVEG